MHIGKNPLGKKYEYVYHFLFETGDSGFLKTVIEFCFLEPPHTPILF